MAVATWNGIEIPLIYSQEIEREIVGDQGRTAGGKLRRDLVAVKRTWRLQTRPMTKTQYDALIGNLESTGWAAGSFWLDELGATVTAYLTIESDARVSFGRDGVWYDNGHELTLTVIEQ